MRSNTNGNRRPIVNGDLDQLYAAYVARGGKISRCPVGVGGYTQAERNAIFSGRKTAEQIADEKAEKLFGKK